MVYLPLIYSHVRTDRRILGSNQWIIGLLARFSDLTRRFSAVKMAMGHISICVSGCEFIDNLLEDLGKPNIIMY